MAITINDLNAITKEYIRPTIVDNYFKAQVLLYRLKAKGEKLGGGTTLRVPVIFAPITSTGSFQGSDTWTAPSQDAISTQAQYQWKENRASLAVSNRDIALNGAENVADIFRMYTDTATMTLAETMSTQLQSDGTGNGGKDIDGLAATLSASSTYAVLDVASFPQWAAKIGTLANPGELTKFDMQAQFGSQTIGNEVPTVIVTTQLVFNKYMSLLTDNKRFVDTEQADGGFETLRFNNKPVVVDNHVAGTGAGTADSWMEFLNEKYLYLYTHKEFNFTIVPVPAQSTSLLHMQHVVWMGNLACSSRRLQGAIKTIDPGL